MSDILEIARQQFQQFASDDPKVAERAQKIINTQKTILGLRTADLKKIAKNLAKTADFNNINKLFDEINAEIYEEISLVGKMITSANLTDAERLDLTKRYLPLVENWAHIDGFVEKRRRQHDRELWWNFALDCLKSDQEFIVRYGVIELMDNHLDAEHIQQVFTAVRPIQHSGYYVKIGLAWLYATAAVKDYRATMHELENTTIDIWIRRKAYTKMLESYRMTTEQKTEIRAAREKLAH